MQIILTDLLKIDAKVIRFAATTLQVYGTPGHGKIFLSSAPPIELHVSGPNELIGLTH